MQITQVKIQNYKSLRSVSLEPSGLTVVVGANGSGKSNLADCIDFVSEIYSHGLEMAVARKGGYDNIAHHKKKRSRRPISIDVTVTFDWTYIGGSRNQKRPELKLKCRHQFDFVTKGSSITAEFRVVREQVDVSTLVEETRWVDLLHVARRIDPKGDSRRPDRLLTKFASGDFLDTILLPNERPEIREIYLGFSRIRELVKERRVLPATELLMPTLGMRGLFVGFVRAMKGIKVFQLSPTLSRSFGVPTPNPELARTGDNLPAVLDLIKKRFKDNWDQILQIMRGVLPDLENIEVGYNTSRTLSLFFKESEAGRPWNVDEVSDGTIQTLAMLIAIFDPRSTALVIEEPENSVHPWIIRNILEACVSASKSKHILLTTHSPIVVDSVPPEQVWVIWRASGESKLSRLTDLDPTFLSMWQTGKVSTFDFIDSGGLHEALPPLPIIDDTL